MWRNKLFWGVVCIAIFLVAIPAANAEVVVFSEDFEGGIPPDWSIDNGVWEICMPEEGDPGPQEAHGGYFCAATVCKDNYPRYTDSRLISPSFWLDTVTGDEELHLCFWHWFSYSGGDYGYVQISEFNETTEDWSPWEYISSAIGYSASAVWSPKSIDISEYAGKKVRIAFYHQDDDGYYQSSGWYIDHIRITCGGSSLFPHFCECDLNQDGMCDMQDWLFFGEDWGRTDCGTPPGSGCLPNDCECDLNHDGSCDMLDWLRFGEDWGQTDCLICE